MVQVLRHRDQMVLDIREVQSLFLVFASAKRDTGTRDLQKAGMDLGTYDVGFRSDEPLFVTYTVPKSALPTVTQCRGKSTHIAWLDL
jgi:hypothetical protein